MSSKIEWTDDSWNPVRARRKDTGKTGTHCERVSDGCKHCYAARHNGRMLPNGGTGLDYTRPAREKVDIYLDEKMLTQPMRWRKPRMVFVCSLTDLFGEFVPFDLIDRVFAAMALCPQHTFQVLTKRPERMAEYLRAHDTGRRWCLAAEKFGGDFASTEAAHWSRNGMGGVWLGTSIEDQATADERILHLLRCPAAVRFLSCEPLLGAVGLHMSDSDEDGLWRHQAMPVAVENQRPDWVIVGGESGPGARPMHPYWPRSIRDQCVAAGVPFFFNQWGEYGPDQVKKVSFTPVKTGETMFRVGKKAAGRLLDGREWNEMPADLHRATGAG